MSTSLWSFRSDKGIKSVLKKFAKKCRKYEKEIEDDSNNIKFLSKRIEKAIKIKDAETVFKLREELMKSFKEKYDMQKKDIEELENIKHYIEILEAEKTNDIRKDRKLIQHLKDKHELSEQDANNLYHFVGSALHFLHHKITIDHQRQYKLHVRMRKAA